MPNIITLAGSKPGEKASLGPYRHTGYVQFLDHEGYPAIKPPWGVLTAIDLNSGEFAWQVPLGEHPELTARGIPRTGTETFGGSIVTAGGLVFIAGTKDERLHAFDKQTGRLLWEHASARGRLRDPFDLPGERPPIRRHRGGRGRQAPDEGGRRVRGVQPARSGITE